MPRAVDVDDALVDDVGANVPSLCGDLRERTEDIDLGDRAGGREQRRRVRVDLGEQRFELFPLEFDLPCSGAEYRRLELFEVDVGETFGIDEALLAREVGRHAVGLRT